jgi:transposase-like protein
MPEEQRQGSGETASATPDRIVQNPTKADANASKCKTNPPLESGMVASRQLATCDVLKGDKSLQNPTEADANRSNGKTNPPTPERPGDAKSRVRKPAEQLSQRQLAAIGLLCRGYTVAKAARAVGVSRQTVWEWKRQQRFAELMARVSAEMLQTCLPAGGPPERSPQYLERQRRLIELCRRPRGPASPGV